MGVLPAGALAGASTLHCLRGVLRHSELELASISLVVVLRLGAVQVVVILLVIFSDLLRLNDAHAYPEQASAAHQKLA